MMKGKLLMEYKSRGVQEVPVIEFPSKSLFLSNKKTEEPIKFATFAAVV